MATVQATGIVDLVQASLNELGRLKWTDNMSGYQNTIAMKRLIKKNKFTFDSGPEIQFNFMYDHANSARWVPLGANDEVDIPAMLANGKIPWRHITWNWAMDRREPIMNSGASKIVDLIKMRRTGAMGAAIIKFEQAFWRVPAADDEVTMYGVPYYIVKSNTANTTNEGFNGNLPSGYSTVANISTTTYPRWKNYATQYTTVSKDDLVVKWRHMAHYTDFKPLVDNTPVYNLGDDLGYYTNYAVLSVLEQMLEAQNENLGNDVASKDGMAMFRRVPVMAVKELDLDTTNPVYAINWGELFATGLRTEWMKEVPIPIQANQHTVSVTHTDCTLNLLCRDRRRQGVLATNTTMGY